MDANFEDSRTRRMKPALVAVMSLLLLLFGCSRKKLVEGGLYYTPAEKGSGYNVLKILKLDDHGVHIRLYSNHFVAAPTRVDEATLYMAGIDHKPGEALGIGHLPLSTASFAGWRPVFVQQSTVKPDELEGYEEWKKASAGYF